ncbi:MAG: DUF2254 domain-containing protein [Paracoccaceae bacterium]
MTVLRDWLRGHSIPSLPGRAGRWLRRLWRRLGTRVALMGLAAVAVIGAADLLAPFVPETVATYVAGDAVDRLLDLIAGAMLAVTIFSITVMVSVHRSSASQWTPRVHRLIMRDPVTQSTIATFVGAYVYSLIGIVVRELRVFPDDAATVLFAVTVAVMAWIVFAIVRWTLHLQTFGSLIQTTRRIEEIAEDHLRRLFEVPRGGARELPRVIPPGATDVVAQRSGYVRHIDVATLQAIARERDLRIYLPHPVGRFVQATELQAHVTGGPDDEALSAIADAIEMGDARDYEHDPRFALIVLGEIASKALSPGVNDTGTAIDILTRIVRVLTIEAGPVEDPPDHDRVHMPSLDPHALVEDAFGGMARDGQGNLSLQLRLHKALGKLIARDWLSDAVERFGARELRRACDALTFAPDRDALLDVAHPRIVERAGVRG